MADQPIRLHSVVRDEVRRQAWFAVALRAAAERRRADHEALHAAAQETHRWRVTSAVDFTGGGRA